ncbi:hypothetical protein CIL05_07240 [Virgibacillus profundi]|uniref:Uncharacterized protein n=1 Tax=Virgibacillus profundi TaxID=2024555 RepID=A0A2A2IGJ6_9BACI|nr:hypothetical protein [Virgibacillus profundi]PAV30255.1 hypothetical protein CIL05_07240 [Virgibacillus profundi]PXY54427.1 hypothetical protein CIT14_07325 [Virgibacillus profundi]
MELLKCAKCDTELSDKMEIEYSRWVTEYFCNPDCAMSYYFEYMGSVPFDVHDLPESLKHNKVKAVNGKLYDIS